jgi:hypothetical protein
MSLRPLTLRPVSMTLAASSAIPSTSSSVSVGRPHMKYSFTCRQPAAYAAATVSIRSCSLTCLLITRRSRSEPPSGANVSPDRRPLRDSSLARSMLNASTRVDGSDNPVCVPSYRSASPRVISAISEWSADDSDSSPTSSYPVAPSPCSTIAPMPVIERSRTGRVIMPAWQNRQPRVQPRKISTLIRSWTVSASGTSGVFGYGHSSRSITVCLADPRRDAGCGSGTTRSMRPSRVYSTSVESPGRRRPRRGPAAPASPSPATRAGPRPSRPPPGR